MVRNRKGLAPWSLAREAGIESATVDGTIEVPQYVQPVLDTGFVDEKGDWKGAKSSDKDFIAFHTDLAIANGASILTPDINADGSWPLSMEGYNDIFLAIKTTSGGNYALKAVMGPDSLPFANLNPVNAAATLKYSQNFTGTSSAFTTCLDDSSETLTADVWNILKIEGRLAHFLLLQFSIENNSGAQADIETAFMRLV